MSTNWEIISAIYDEAIDLEESSWHEFVSKKCKEDLKIFTQVMKMLEASHSQDFMGEYPGKINPENIEFSKPEQLGHFKILKKIATGGMGRVYLAQSIKADVPIKVALKTIRIELINDELKRKFQNEKKILSQLRHKNIASLIDAGITDDHIPYIATEWVNGVTINHYCQDNNLSLKKRLNLFIQVCQAVAFAHNKLIIHRDIKPDNILVNQQGQVKLLDFGIAKIVDENQNIQTATQIFTPDYAAPEQLNGETCTLTTDIYSLGIVLFELLTDSRKFDLQNLSVKKKLDLINNPSYSFLEKITSNNELPYARKKLKGTLTKIVNKAMHIDPSRRYGSVHSLLEDIENYLTNRPIKAMKDSYFYRLKMSVVRNKLASSFMLLSIIAIVIGVIFSVNFLKQKQIEAKKAEAMLSFFQDILKTASPKQGGSTNITVKEMFERGVENYRLEKIVDPYIQAELSAQIGKIYTQLENSVKGEEYLNKAINYYKNNLSNSDNVNKYIKYKQELINLYLYNQNYKKALLMFNQLKTEIGIHQINVKYQAWNYYFLGVIYNQSDYTKSMNYFDLANKLANENNFYLLLGKIARIKYSLFYNRLNDEESNTLLNAAQINFKKSQSKESQINLLHTIIAKANLLSAQGEFNQAEKDFVNAQNKQLEIYGFNDFTILMLRARNLIKIGQFVPAYKYLLKAESLYLKAILSKEQRYYEIVLNKAITLIELGKFVKAQNIIDLSLEYFKLKLPPNHIYFKLINTIMIDLNIKSENSDAMRATMNIKWDFDKMSWFNKLNLANIYLFFEEYESAKKLYENIVINSNEQEKIGMLYLQAKTGLELCQVKRGKIEKLKSFQLAKKNLLKTANPNDWYDKFYSIN